MFSNQLINTNQHKRYRSAITATAALLLLRLRFFLVAACMAVLLLYTVIILFSSETASALARSEAADTSVPLADQTGAKQTLADRYSLQTTAINETTPYTTTPLPQAVTSTVDGIYFPVLMVQEAVVQPHHTAVLVAQNGSFESGTAHWNEFSTVGQSLILPSNLLGVVPYSGQWGTRLGLHNDEVSMVSQSVSIPLQNSCLVYWYWTISADSCNADFGGVGINGDWVSIDSLCAGTATGHWTRRTVSMTAHTISPTVVLNFAVSNDYSVPSIMYVDDVSFQPGYLCDDSVRAAAQAGAPDEAARYLGQPILETKGFK